MEQHLLDEPIIWFVAALLCFLVLDVLVKSISRPAEQPPPPAKASGN